MAPSNGTTSTPPKLAVTLRHSTLQWHPAMAPRPLPQSWSSPSPPTTNHSTLQWHPTMAPSNGTTSTAPCNGTLVPRPIRQSGSSPSRLLEVRTPIAIAIWGINFSFPKKNVAQMWNSGVLSLSWFTLGNHLLVVTCWSATDETGGADEAIAVLLTIGESPAKNPPSQCANTDLRLESKTPG